MKHKTNRQETKTIKKMSNILKLPKKKQKKKQQNSKTSIEMRNVGTFIDYKINL